LANRSGTTTLPTHLDATYLASLVHTVGDQGLGWTPGPTFFSGFAVDRFLASVTPTHRGAPPGPPLPPVPRTDPVAATAGLGAPPPALDWSDRNGQSFVEPVRHQGMVNACLAYAVAGLVGAQSRIETGLPRQAARGYALPGVSARQLFWYGPQGVWAAQAAVEALGYAAHVGLVPAYEEDRLIHLLGGRFDEAMARSVTKVRRVVVFSRRQTDLAKAWLAHRGPLLVTLVLPENLDLLFYRGGVYRPSCDTFVLEGGHSCVVVGYDDDRQAWKIQNSWGTDWGEQGYLWVAYGAGYLESQMIGIDGVEVFLAPPGRTP
jgi:hypothetical protein